MRSFLHSLLCLTTLARAQSPSINSFTQVEIASGDAFRNISDVADQRMRETIGGRASPSCTYANADVRKEWRTLPRATRKAFTDAVTCLQRMKPQRMTASQAASYPGVHSRYDEYVATHINYTYNIHDTADFFAWHRGFVHFLEQDLRNLCGYASVMPYWDWSQDAEAPQDSPLFSGDAYSMGSNGKFVAGRTDTWLAQQDIVYPPGLGGGCVEKGPFRNYTVNLGPLSLPGDKNVATMFQYNPRCLERDINPWFSRRYSTYTNLTSLMLENIYLEDFQDLSQGYGSATNKFGVHGGGHWQIGGSMMDFNSSPSDPLFYLHHAMVDRMWLIWQYLDIWNRQFAISGSDTLGCKPPNCPQMTLDDRLPFGFVAPDQTFRSLMDTFGGALCYRYE